MLEKLKNLNLEKIWLSGIKAGVFLILFTPAVFAGIVIVPFMVSKTIYFRVLVEIIFLFYIFLLLENRKYLPKISPIFISVSIFIGILAFSVWQGINPLRSFWGTAERMEGFVLLLHLFAFFLVLIAVFRQKKDWLDFLRFTVLFSIPIGIAGFFEKFGIYYIYAHPDDPRINATFGNPIFYGNYLTLIIFLGIFLFLAEKARIPKVSFLIITVFNFLLLLWTGTRGSWLGIALGMIFLLLVWFLFFSGRIPEKRKAFLFIIFISLLFFFLFILLSQAGYLSKTVFFERYESLWFNLVNFDNSRINLWKLGLDAWKKSPLLGYGPESYPYIYDKYYQAHFLDNIPEFNFFNRPHNKLIGLLVHNGIIGLLSYLAIFGIAILTLLKNRAKEKFGRFLPFVLIAFLIAYFVQNLFTFDVISTYLFLFLILAFIDANFRKKEKNQSKNIGYLKNIEYQKSRIFKIIIGFFTFLLFAIIVFETNMRPFWVYANLQRVYVFVNTGEPQKALKPLEKALNGPDFTKFESHYYAAYIIYAKPSFRDKGMEKKFSQELQKIALSSEDYLNAKPEVYQMRGYFILAKIYEKLYLMEKNPRYLEDEERILNKAIKFNSQFPYLYQLSEEMKFFQEKEKALTR